MAGLHLLREEQVISPDETVVCILTGHELKDPNVTVKYHTGIDTRAAQDQAPRTEPTGKLSNQSIPVADNINAIIRAVGGDPTKVKVSSTKAAGAHVPVAEF